MPKGQRLVKSKKPKPTRGEILAMYDQGHTTSEVCAALGVCHAWARRVKQERRELGKTKNSTTRRRTSRWMVYKAQIEEALARQPAPPPVDSTFQPRQERADPAQQAHREHERQPFVRGLST